MLLDIIHGDIKPENVLVFKSSKGRGTFKMSDFGYSTLTTNEEDIISLPCSPPWNAPEIHHRGFSLARAKMADIYSFGLLCLWILFKDDPLNLEDITTPAACENVNSLDQLIREKFLIAYLKKNNMMVGIADKLVQQSDLPTEDQLSLKKFFITMLSFDPEQRNCDLEELIKYINPGW